MSTFSQRASALLREALKRHGTYAFDDKGPGEVMDTRPLVNEAKVDPTTLGGELKALASSGDRETVLAGYILMDLQGEAEAWFEQMLTASGLEL